VKGPDGVPESFSGLGDPPKSKQRQQEEARYSDWADRVRQRHETSATNFQALDDGRSDENQEEKTDLPDGAVRFDMNELFDRPSNVGEETETDGESPG